MVEIIYRRGHLTSLPPPNGQSPVEHHTTIEDLARMINEGFKITTTKDNIKEITTRLDGIDSRLDRIEHLLPR